jgi:hypothetical protein
MEYNEENPRSNDQNKGNDAKKEQENISNKNP